MNLDTLVVDPIEAKARLREYQGVIAAERSAEDEAIAAGYRAAARGLPVISLKAAMAAGGLFENRLPRLAICRADATECHVRIDGRWRNTATWEVTFYDGPWGDNRGALVGVHSVRTEIPSPVSWSSSDPTNAKTIVPIVPPRHRPSARRLRNCHILWEVEQWTMVPPRDPALLKHIRGDLWAVLSTWDLTDLERAVLAQRAR